MAATVSKLLDHLKSVTPKEELIGLDEMATDPEKRSQQLECKANDDIEVSFSSLVMHFHLNHYFKLHICMILSHTSVFHHIKSSISSSNSVQ